MDNLINRKMNRKGILFTAGLVLMASVLLTLAILLFYNTMESEERFIEMSSLDTMHNLYDSVDNGIREILFGTLGDDYVIVNQIEDQVVFKEGLSNIDYTNFEGNLTSFKSFVESNFGGVSLNITEMNNTLPLVVYPHEVVYTHPNGFGGNEIGVYPSNYSILEGYEVSFNVTPDGCPVNYTSDGSFSVNITGCGDMYLNPNGISYFQLNFSNKFVNITFGAGANLTILALDNFENKVFVNISLKDLNETITVETPRETDLINVALPGYGVKKIGGARLR